MYLLEIFCVLFAPIIVYVKIMYHQHFYKNFYQILRQRFVSLVILSKTIIVFESSLKTSHEKVFL